MALTPEQTATVTRWVAAGDNLSTIQKKLADELKVVMTYMDVRFLVDDLNLTIKDAAPKVDASDVSKTPAKAPAPQPAAAEGTEADALPADDLPAADGELPEEPAPAGASTVTIEVDKVNLNPNALASGSVTFSDGVTAKWMIDHQGRPGLTQVSQPGYRPTPADGQAFMQELSQALQQRGY